MDPNGHELPLQQDKRGENINSLYIQNIFLFIAKP
jgi:hypothetical protein